jgi:hypothetical protein
VVRSNERPGDLPIAIARRLLSNASSEDALRTRRPTIGYVRLFRRQAPSFVERDRKLHA